MTFFDALKYIRATEGRKICRDGTPSQTVEWYTTPEAAGFKDQADNVIASFSTADLLAEDWGIAGS